ncbi:hypothetical protein [Taibaiella soli]|uniref:FAS1 domain-containing protein n=1 Tax=Taibaiella soli TaxID=1649169 RepID=A0A2W2BNK4_9BACT|nr:hypothetical protein [Taibaiella soli]PZF74986.1 hypothetical protein DN068_00075 [Taibaiella soli]
MKPTILLTAMILGFMLLACNKHETEAAKPQQPTAPSNNPRALERNYPDNYPFSSFISIDSGNKMLESYLASLSDNDDSSIHSFIFNADSLRSYLNDPRITNVKLMFGHTLEYINEGNYGKPTAYTSGNLTIIVAGYDMNGSYVYKNGNKVLEHAMPCPHDCATGAAAGSTLTY